MNQLQTIMTGWKNELETEQDESEIKEERDPNEDKNESDEENEVQAWA